MEDTVVVRALGSAACACALCVFFASPASPGATAISGTNEPLDEPPATSPLAFQRSCSDAALEDGAGDDAWSSSSSDAASVSVDLSSLSSSMLLAFSAGSAAAAPPGVFCNATRSACLACMVAHMRSRMAGSASAAPPSPPRLAKSVMTWYVITSSSSIFCVASVTAACHARVCVCHPISRLTYRRILPTAATLMSLAASMISSISFSSSSSSESRAPNCCTLCSQTLSMIRLMTRFDGGFSPK
mmetsp:Transcript_3762/g.13902  ORF Transcript_3762/g.13902 Transcript_3762/m.13902 type:complete len:244 (-) Transcript_3762:1932-2663(-)